jgi:hypothetical protein
MLFSGCAWLTPINPIQNLKGRLHNLGQREARFSLLHNLGQVETFLRTS